jgi:hypothetical protein
MVVFTSFTYEVPKYSKAFVYVDVSSNISGTYYCTVRYASWTVCGGVQCECPSEPEGVQSLGSIVPFINTVWV